MLDHINVDHAASQVTPEKAVAFNERQVERMRSAETQGTDHIAARFFVQNSIIDVPTKASSIHSPGRPAERAPLLTHAFIEGHLLELVERHSSSPDQSPSSWGMSRTSRRTNSFSRLEDCAYHLRIGAQGPGSGMTGWPPAHQEWGRCCISRSFPRPLPAHAHAQIPARPTDILNLFLTAHISCMSLQAQFACTYSQTLYERDLFRYSTVLIQCPRSLSLLPNHVRAKKLLLLGHTHFRQSRSYQPEFPASCASFIAVRGSSLSENIPRCDGSVKGR